MMARNDQRKRGRGERHCHTTCQVPYRVTESSYIKLLFQVRISPSLGPHSPGERGERRATTPYHTWNSPSPNSSVLSYVFNRTRQIRKQEQT